MIKSIAAATMVLAVTGFAAGACAGGDREAGEGIYKKCVACHEIGEGAANGIGPHLNGIVGQAAAAVEGFGYSDALRARAAEGLVWTEAELDNFVAAPYKFLKGSTMSFAGLREEKQRADLIDYMKTFE